MVFCECAAVQVSYMILQRVSPVTHSVGNCVKRVVVIVSSVIFFQTPVSPVNAFGKTFEDLCFDVLLTIYPCTTVAEILNSFSTGTAVALAGVFLYSRVKRIKSKPKTA